MMVSMMGAESRSSDKTRMRRQQLVRSRSLKKQVGRVRVLTSGADERAFPHSFSMGEGVPCRIPCSANATLAAFARSSPLRDKLILIH